MQQSNKEVLSSKRLLDMKILTFSVSGELTRTIKYVNIHCK